MDKDYKLVEENVFLKLRDAFGVQDGHQMPEYQPWVMIKTEAAAPASVSVEPEVDRKPNLSTLPLASEEAKELVQFTANQSLTLGDVWSDYIFIRYKNALLGISCPTRGGSLSLK